MVCNVVLGFSLAQDRQDYQRDSVEHSSSESAGTTHTHTHTQPHTHTHAHAHAQDEWRAPPALHPAPRPFSLLRAFVPSFIFVCLSLALLTLLVFETDWPPLRPLKRKPELLSLRHHYYAPLKEYLKRKVIELFWFRLERFVSTSWCFDNFDDEFVFVIEDCWSLVRDYLLNYL